MNLWVLDFLRRTRRFTSARKGVSAVEFALIAPVLVIILLGSAEVSFMMQTDRKVTQAANALGDLVAQDTEINTGEMNDIFEAARAVLEPNPTASAKMRVTSVVDVGGGVFKVDWSRGKNMSPHAAGATLAIPAGLIPPNGSIIMSEMEYNYVSMFGQVAPGTTVLQDTFYLRPRRANKVVFK